MTRIIRQGDVTLVRVTEVHGQTKGITELAVLAEGETTGTRHMLRGQIRETVIPDLDRRFFEVLEGGGVLEQTGSGAHHLPMTVEPGIWEVKIAREHDFYEGVSRQTAD